jgi:integrase
MATAFWAVQKGKRVLLVKWRDAAGRWIGPRRARACRTLEHARRFAEDKERQAERQRHGLEPLPGDQHLTFGALFDRWWECSGRRRRSKSKFGFKASLEKHLGQLRPFALNPGTAGAFAQRLEAILDDKAESGELAPQTLNHLRAGAFRIFEYASDPKCGLWTSQNPVKWVARKKGRKHKRLTFRREEVAPVLAAFPEPRLGSPWRWSAAVCLFTGARPGEAMGLHKEDIDDEEWVLTIGRSWSAPVPKDEEPRVVPIPPELRPYLRAAMLASPNHLVFPQKSGEMFDEEARRMLVKQLRRAAAKAGLVKGYRHTCRRCKALSARALPGAPAVFAWEYPDAAQRQCPTCGMKLWIAAIPKPYRFYDLRHTNATLLRKARVDLGTVQRQLGHASPETTDSFYDHSDVLDDRESVERVLTFDSRESKAERAPDAGAEGITTGSPSPVTPPAGGAPVADPGAACSIVDSSPYAPVRLPVSCAKEPSQDWGASGRWFKSSRPDHLKAPEFLTKVSGSGAFVFPPLDDPQYRRRTRLLRRRVLLLESQPVEPAAHVLHVEVAVDLRSQRRIGVAHHLLDDRKRYALLEEERRRGVSQVVEADVPGERLGVEREPAERTTRGLRDLPLLLEAAPVAPATVLIPHHHTCTAHRPAENLVGCHVAAVHGAIGPREE